MARKVKKIRKANPNSPFWHPSEKGESLSGTFAGFTRTLMGVVLQLRLSDETEKPIGMSANLKQTFKPIAESMKIGEKLTFTFLGVVKTKKGRPCKTFEVTYKGKKLAGGGDFKRSVGADAAKLFE